MTVGDLLDSLAFKEGDTEGDFRTSAMRWLNLARSEIADAGSWRGAYNASARITTDGRATGVYTLVDSGGVVYDEVVGQVLHNETNNTTIWNAPLSDIELSDPARDDTASSPALWADLGFDDSGNRQVMLWPVPPTGMVIRFRGLKRLSDLVLGTHEASEVDPYFGPVARWAACFRDGIEYQYLRDVNESRTAIADAYGKFMRSISLRRVSDGLQRAPVSEMSPVKGSSTLHPIYGRLDPAHYSNRR